MSNPSLVAVIVEDEKQIRRFVRMALEGEGWNVFEAETVRQGLTEAGTRKPDLLIIDLGLPDGNGVDMIRDIRTWSNVPIIVLSAHADEKDKVRALDAGGDDYLTKPFGIAELMARVRATLRRQRLPGNENGSIFELGDIRVDVASRIVTKGKEQIHLTPIEYRLLNALISNLGRVLTHRQLLQDVWGPSHSESSHYLRVYMSHLRQKLEDDPAQPKYILTETGVGYRLAP